MKDRVKGWCPSLLRPMQSADGWILRLKPPYCQLSGEAARVIAEASRTYGEGKLELTRRASLQLRGMAESGLEPVARQAIELGLASDDAAVEARRNILVSPLLGADPRLAEASRCLVRRLEIGLTETQLLAGLPEKFGFLVDGGGLWPLTEASDLSLRPGARRLDLGGHFALHLSAQQDAARAALAISEAFTTRCERAQRRLSTLGAEQIAALVAQAGLSGRIEALDVGGTKKPTLGFHQLDDTVGAVLALWPFGALSAQQLEDTAGLAETFGDGIVRLTPWRCLAIAGVSSEVWPELAVKLGSAGALLDPLSASLRIEACPGAPACAEASAKTRCFARQLAAVLPPDRHAHVSGCSKGCAHPRETDLTFVGAAGGWFLIRNGTAASPTALGLSSSEQALEEVRRD